MFTRILIVGLCVAVATGCARRNAKKPTATDEPSVTAAKPMTPLAAIPSDKKGGEPNWLGDSRFEKDSGPGLPADAPPGGKPGWGLPKGDYTAPPPPAGMPMGAPNGNGVLQPEPVKPPPAAPAAPVAPTTAPKYSPVAEADMKEVWIFIENASGASGKMPSPALTYQALVTAESKAAPLVKDGSIYLTGATTRESVWAFEMKALTHGGLVATQNGVETLTAAELKKRLGK